VKFTFRWFGSDDPVMLAAIQQIPGIEGIVTALHQLPAGAVWPLEEICERKRLLGEYGFEWAVAESILVHQSIKLGEPERDRYIENYAMSIRNLGQAGVGTLCYNFMPVFFDWFRTELAYALPDACNTMCYVHDDLERYDLTLGMEQRIACTQGYTGEQLAELFERYRDVDSERLFSNLVYFLEAIVPAAEEAGVSLAIHPDDPPWPIFGLPRIVNEAAGIRRILDAVDSPNNGLTFCTGSLGASSRNDLVAMAREFAPRVHFVHARNVKRTGERDFYECAHPVICGDVDIYGCSRPCSAPASAALSVPTMGG
jgi:mannonate dehydratase